MLEWHQKMMTVEQSTPNSITSPFGQTKTILVSFKSLGIALQYRMLKNERGVAYLPKGHSLQIIRIIVRVFVCSHLV